MRTIEEIKVRNLSKEILDKFKQNAISQNGQSGCFSSTHGMSKTRLYFIWGSMIQRCKNPNNKSYKYYGGRGICVCNEWLTFESFAKWATENGYKEGLSIDRINNNEGYNPANCRWATALTQIRNRTGSIFITYQNKTKPINEWANLLGINYRTLYNRYVEKGWSAERSLFEKVSFDTINREYTKEAAEQALKGAEE